MAQPTFTLLPGLISLILLDCRELNAVYDHPAISEHPKKFQEAMETKGNPTGKDPSQGKYSHSFDCSKDK
jgi:hypothetical protein